MGLFSGNKTQTTQLSTTNYDQRQVNTDSNNTSFDSNNTTTIFNQLDGGAIGAGIDAAKSAIAGILSMGSQTINAATQSQVHAYDYADGLFSASLEAVQDAGTREMKAWERAAAVQDIALNSVKGAYADAKGTTDSQKQIMLGVLVVAGVIALSAMKARA